MDFVDTNEQGEIVLSMVRKPMFPEEFTPGMKDHLLSWWGIVEPSLGRGKYAPLQQEQEQQPRLQPQEETKDRFNDTHNIFRVHVGCPMSETTDYHYQKFLEIDSVKMPYLLKIQQSMIK